MSTQTLGELELNVLKFISDNDEMSVRDVAHHFEKQKGLARTTILTVMDRLRKKGFLKRQKVNGLFVYSTRVEKDAVVRQKITDFVRNTLGGSHESLLSYFAQASDITEPELQSLREIAKKLEGGRK